MYQCNSKIETKKRMFLIAMMFAMLFTASMNVMAQPSITITSPTNAYHQLNTSLTVSATITKGPQFMHYHVYVRNNSTNENKLISENNTAVNFLRTVNTNGWQTGAYTVYVVSYKTDHSEETRMPFGFTLVSVSCHAATNINATSVTLSGSASNTSNYGSQYRLVGSSTWNWIYTSPSTITGLHPGKTYEHRFWGGYASNTFYDPSSTVYANFTTKPSTVTLDRNSGTGGTSSVNGTYDAAMPSATMPTRTGYQFQGYYDATSGGTQYYTSTGASARSWNKAVESATLYARWSANVLTINYAGGGASGSKSSTSHDYNASVSLPSNPYTRPGYVFAGWAISGSGSGNWTSGSKTTVDLTNVNSINTANRSITLTAQWTANKLTINYAGGGGSGSKSATTHDYNASVSLPSNPYTRQGYTFAGWVISGSGSGNWTSGSKTTVDLTNVNSINTANRSITLTAQWTVNKLTINYAAGGGTGSKPATTHDYNASISCPANTFNRPGYEFDNWAISGAGSGNWTSGSKTTVDLTNLNSISTASRSITLTAQWKTNVDAETPNISVSPQSATYIQNASASALSVTATVTKGTLSYQWYRNTTNSNSGGTSVGTGTTYAPPTTSIGTLYYYVVVTNTDNSASGAKTATATSSTATITVNNIPPPPPPNISVQPQSATYTLNDPASTLSVTASVTDGGALSYQWYRNTTNSSSGGTSVGTGATYTPPTTTTGTLYYYVVVTNTKGSQTATVTSNTATIRVNNIVDAQTPTINMQPQSTTYTKSTTASALSVTASVTDLGTLSYQWYRNTTNSSSGGTSVGTGATYTPPTTSTGTFYYYVVVTNTNNAVNGNKTATATSNTAKIEINDLEHAETPIINSQPQSATYTQPATASALSVTVKPITDGGTLSYQWYRNTTNSSSGGTSVGTGTTYTPPTTSTGTFYYYVVVTNTNNAVNGNKTASATSNTATLEVKENIIVNAETPIINSQPQSATYTHPATASALSVTVKPITDGGTLSYQWYRNTTNSNSGGTSVGTGTTYTPPTTTTGTFYYYVVVTNTNNSVNGTKTASATSNTATIEVKGNLIVNAQTPIINVPPQSATYTQNASASALSATTTVTDGGTLSYQWYRNTTNNNSGGTSVGTGTTYTPPTTSTGTLYYYVVVTNTNNSVNGTKTASATSNTATITVIDNVVSGGGNGTAGNPWKIGDTQTNTAAAVTAVLNGNTLTISGSGNMADFWSSAEGEAPWWFNTTNRNAIQFVIIESGVTNIGQRAFKDCSNLAAIKIPNSVLKINAQSFYNCPNLLAIENLATIPQNIDNEAFQGSTAAIYLQTPEEATAKYKTTNIWKNFKFVEPYVLLDGFPSDEIDEIILGPDAIYFLKYQKNNPNLLEKLIVSDGVSTEKLAIFDYGSDGSLRGAHIDNTLFTVTHTTEGRCNISSISSNGDYNFVDNILWDIHSASVTLLKRTARKWALGKAEELVNRIMDNSLGFQIENTAPSWIGLTKTIVSVTGVEDFMPPSVKVIYTGFMGVFSGVSMVTSCGSALLLATTPITLPAALPSIALCAYNVHSWLKDREKFKEALEALDGNNKNTGCSVTATLYGGTLVISGSGALCTEEINKFADRKNEIKKLVIGSGVTIIPAGAFSGYSNLKSVTIENGNEPLTFQTPSFSENSAFYDSSIGSLYLRRTVRYGYRSSPFEENKLLTSLAIGKNVASIGDDCFNGCIGLTSLTIESGSKLTSIGNNSFKGCVNLASSLNIPDGVTTIGTSAFLNCEKMPSLIIPNSVTSIGASAFANCKNLKRVEIKEGNEPLTFQPPSFSEISAFFGSPIEMLILRRTVSYGSSVSPFQRNTLLTSLTIGKNVASIGDDCFNGCIGLTSLTIESGSKLTSIGNNSFKGCVNLASSLNIPDRVTTIGTSAFLNCEKIPSLIIPNSVTSIGASAFADCKKLKRVEIKEGNEPLIFETPSNSNYAAFYDSPIEILILGRTVSYGSSVTPFEGNKLLTSLTIGKNVASINTNCFRGCTGLTQITSNATSPPTLQSNTFYNVNKSIPVYINCNNLSAYQSAQYWSEFTNYQCAAQVTPSSNSAVISFPEIDNATAYKLNIYSDENHTNDVIEIDLDVKGNTKSAPAQNVLKAAATTLSYTVSGLSANTQYYYSLTPYNASGYMLSVFTGEFKTTGTSNSIESVFVSQISIYPNPTRDEIFIKSDSPIKKVEIYSLTGVLMMQEINFNEKMTVSSLQKGIYIVKVYTENNFEVHKIVKE